MTNEKNNDNYEVPKLNIKQVLKESFGIYKSSFKAFIMLSAIIFIITFGTDTMNYFDKLFKSYTYVKLLYILVNLVYPFVSMYVYSRIDMAIYMLSEKVSEGNKITAREVFAETKGLFWRFIGVILQYILVLVLPVIGIYTAYKYIESPLLKYAIIALLLIPLLYLTVKYYFAIISVALKKEDNQYLRRSKLLAIGDFWTILFLIIVSNIIFQLSSFIFITVFDSKSTIELNKFIISSISGFLFIFITPFSHIVTTVMYLTLRRNKKIN